MSRVQIAPSALLIIMTIGLLQLRLFLPQNQSLKGKRQVLQGLKARIRQRFNVSVCEMEDQDKWQAAVLGVACVGIDRARINRCLDQVADLAREEREAEVTDVQLEFL